MGKETPKSVCASTSVQGCSDVGTALDADLTCSLVPVLKCHTQKQQNTRTQVVHKSVSLPIVLANLQNETQVEIPGASQPSHCFPSPAFP